MNPKSHSTLKLLVLACVVFLAPLLLTSNTALAAVMVDINRADAATMIANWKGIGEKKAKAIVAYRKKNGPFSSVSDLTNVKGIGEGLIKKNKKYMSVKGGAKVTQKPAASTTKKSSKKKSTTKKSTGKKKSDSKSTDSKSKSKTKKKE